MKWLISAVLILALVGCGVHEEPRPPDPVPDEIPRWNCPGYVPGEPSPCEVSS